MKIGDYASESGVEGLGFAIPITSVKTVLEQLANQGYVAGRPCIGLTGQPLSTFYQIYYHYPAGLLVTEVEQGSDAARKGIRYGDILTSLDGIAVTSLDVLEQILYDCEVGEEITATIYRNGIEYSLTIILGEDKN